MNRLLDAARIPKSYRRADSFDVSRLPHDVREQYAEVARSLRAATARPRAVIGLCGSRGPGKTHMSCAEIVDHCRRRLGARYAVTADYFGEIGAEFGRGGSVLAVERRMREPHLLVLDEIQVRAQHSWQEQRLIGLIDHRYANDKVTIIAGNLTAEELQRSVGPSIEDRFHEAGGVLECSWESLRGRLLEAN